MTAVAESVKTNTVCPQYRVHRLDQSFELEVFLPGIDESGLELNVEDRVLKIKGTAPESETPQLRCIHQEFTLSDYAAEFRLPHVIDVDGIQASLKNGVLKVTLPKMKEHESRAIQVQAL